MFNFIVKASGWGTSNGSIMKERVFEYTDDELMRQFLPKKGSLQTEALSKLPTLLVSEIGGSGEQAARLATITSISELGSVYQLEYTIDGSVAAIPNARINELRSDLGIEDFELRRTHWAVKKVDLFKTLFRHRTEIGPRPYLFRLSDKPVDEKKISAMMPFDARFARVYEALGQAATECGMHIERADNIWKDDAIIQDIVTLICESKIVLCDLTDKNPNVFYELGIAHCLGKNVIPITQSSDHVPFDVRHVRHIQYLNNTEGLAKLTEEVRKRITTLIS